MSYRNISLIPLVSPDTKNIKFNQCKGYSNWGDGVKSDEGRQMAKMNENFNKSMKKDDDIYHTIKLIQRNIL